ncbi:hypothetical protein AB0M10_15180 [Streptomyces sp. NPDC051840]|uniref:hypothetical protein n=1 Tax=Streptomyces sp. NPDC051840 TaxID=3154752 RepID=UPI00344757F9
MRCNTLKGTEPRCTGTATHMLLYPDPVEQNEVRDPVCKPCGDGFVSRPRLKGRIVPLHVHATPGTFSDTIEGHRLVQDPEHEARCHDCGTTGSPNWFKLQTNGCPGRPESIEVLRHSREMLDAEPQERAAEAARLWRDYAVDYLRMWVEDWRVVADDPSYCAFFTFRDREYGVRHDLAAGRFGAEKRPNRGRPAPQLINPGLDTYSQAVFHFHDRVTDSGSEWFATWTPGRAAPADRELVILYTPEGQIAEILRVPGLWPVEEIKGAICDTFGSISSIQFQTRIYQ